MYICNDVEAWFVLWQNDLIIEMPRQRRQVSRYGKQDEAVRISDLETSGSDADYDESGTTSSVAQRGGRRKKRGGRHGRDFDDAGAMLLYGEGHEGYSRSDCFNVEKMLLIFGYDSLFCRCSYFFYYLSSIISSVVVYLCLLSG